jgi:putative transposase
MLFLSLPELMATTCIAAPDMNSMVERVIRSLKLEFLSHLMLFSKNQLKLAVREYIQFYNTQIPHQGLDNKIPIAPEMENGKIICKERLGGLIKSYERLVT